MQKKNTNKLDLTTISSFLRGKNNATLYLKRLKLLFCVVKQLDIDNLCFNSNDHVIYYHALLFNLCFETGESHSKMKVSKVLLIFKKGKKIWSN